MILQIMPVYSTLVVSLHGPLEFFILSSLQAIMVGKVCLLLAKQQ
jgi:hypothetical protein